MEVYDILNQTRILDDYIFTCYDTLHTLGTEYLVEDITEFVKEKGLPRTKSKQKSGLCERDFDSNQMQS